jgi:hypothetical protein
MDEKAAVSHPDVAELRRLAQAAGVGTVSPPPPLRLDDLRRAVDATVARVAALELPAAKAS